MNDQAGTRFPDRRQFQNVSLRLGDIRPKGKGVRARPQRIRRQLQCLRRTRQRLRLTRSRIGNHHPFRHAIERSRFRTQVLADGPGDPNHQIDRSGFLNFPVQFCWKLYRRHRASSRGLTLFFMLLRIRRWRLLRPPDGSHYYLRRISHACDGD